MAIVYSPNVIEIAVQGVYAGAPSVNVWHMYFDGEWGTDTPDAVVRDFANNWQDHILDMVTSEYSVQGFEWRSLDPDDSTLGSIDPDPAKDTAGGVGGEGMPRNVAFLVKKNTTGRPRGARDGRMFLSGVAEADAQETGTIETSRLNVYGPILEQFYDGISDISTFASGDRYPVVLETTAESRAPGTQSVTINSRRVTSITLDPVLSTQRDRLR